MAKETSTIEPPEQVIITPGQYEGREAEIEACKVVMRRHGIPVNKISRLVDEGFKHKENIIQALGLGPDGRRTIEISDFSHVEGIQGYTRLQNFIRNRANDSKGGARDRFYRVNYGDPFDLREALLKNIVSITDEKGRERGTRFMKWFQKEFDMSEFKSYMLDYEGITISDPAVWIGNVIEKAKSGAVPTILSVNPLDFLLSSAEAGFGSCHRPGGEFFNGNIGYSFDEFTLICFTRRKEPDKYPYYKQGRFWVYLDKSNKMFTIARTYGSIYSSNVKEVSRFLSSTLAETQGIEDEWIGKQDFRYPDQQITEGAGYFDYGTSRFTYHKSLTTVEDEENHDRSLRKAVGIAPKMVFAKAMCLSCGCRTMKQRDGTCSDCRPSQCYDCEGPVDEEVAFEHGGDYYCDGCRDRLFRSCSVCEDWHQRSSIAEMRNGNHVCDTCIQGNYFRCVECSYHIPNGDEASGAVNCCTGCYEAEYTQCGTCDRTVRNRDYNYFRGKCDDCCQKQQEEERQERQARCDADTRGGEGSTEVTEVSQGAEEAGEEGEV